MRWCWLVKRIDLLGSSKTRTCNMQVLCRNWHAAELT